MTKGKAEGQFAKAWRHFWHQPLTVIGAVVISMVIISATSAPLIAPYPPNQLNMRDSLAPPSWKHLFGTDRLGRDIFTRVLYGSQIALQIGVLIILVQGTIGITAGLVAGSFGGIMDTVIMRVVDVFLAFPILALALVISAVIGPGLYNVIIALGLAGWTNFARLVRGDVLNIRENDYIEAAKALGASKSRLILRHILPNVLSSIIVLASLTLPSAILLSAAMSFFGLGAQPPMPSWGATVADGRGYLLQAPWISTFPGLAILVTVLAFNLVGDGLRDAFDPYVGRGAIDQQ